jgi:hypothetical protein
VIDQPQTSELLSAMAATLTEQVMPTCEDGAKHAARVVANLCAVLSREADLGQRSAAATTADLRVLLQEEGSLEELVATLDKRLQADDPDFNAAAYPVLLADALRRLAIAKPDYA